MEVPVTNNYSGETVFALLANQAHAHRDSAAILAPGRRALAYEDLLCLIDRTVSTLNGLGIGRSDRVATVVLNGSEAATVFLSVAAGATCAPLNPAYRATEFEFYLQDLKPKALVIAADLDSPARDVARALGIAVIELRSSPDSAAGVFTLEASTPASAFAAFAEPSDIALVLHTSGTTSRPKIVPLTQSSLRQSAENIRRSLELGPADRALNIMPLFHVHGLIGCLLASIAAGASVVCTPAFEAPRFFDWFVEFTPTWYTAVPTMHQAILKQSRRYPDAVSRSRLHFIRSCSSALPPQVMGALEEVFRVPVVEAYGMTEASHQMTCNPLPPAVRKPGSVGIPTGIEVGIMDEVGKPLDREQTGEIVIRGPSVTRGYDNHPEANRDAFVDGWFRTGDLGYQDCEGYLFISGRTKEMINRGGEKISPREIDEALMDHPAVAAAVAFALPDPRLGEDVAAAVVLAENARVNDADLRNFLATRLADFKVPRKIVVVSEIPKGPTGKPQRIGLAGRLDLGAFVEPPAAGAKGPADYVAPRTELEQHLALLWKTFLRLDRVGVQDNYFELGGDSLTAVLLFTQIEKLTGRSLPLATLLNTPTIETLAAVIQCERYETPWECLVAIKPSGSKPPLFCVHGVGGNVLSYHGLVRYIDADQPLYGIQAIGLNGKRPRQNMTVERMAEVYLGEIRMLQPSGPYYLAGSSFGGLVAYEIARQLKAVGEQVAFVGLFDTRGPGYPKMLPTTTKWHRLWDRNRMRFELHWQNFEVTPPAERLTYLKVKTHRFLRATCHGLRQRKNDICNTTKHRIDRMFWPDSVRSMNAAGRWAARDYVAKPDSSLTVTLFRASHQPRGIVADPTLGWGPIASNLEIYETPGHHGTLVYEPRSRVLAQQLTEALETARARITPQDKRIYAYTTS
jgi:acyl-CoA synthetase (AMP-forming)/AMP-acid ligase II/thioesterase domain-containing protein/aryl carrier-like protein